MQIRLTRTYKIKFNFVSGEVVTFDGVLQSYGVLEGVFQEHYKQCSSPGKFFT